MASIVPDRNRNDPNRTTTGHTPPRSNNINMGPKRNLIPREPDRVTSGPQKGTFKSRYTPGQPQLRPEQRPDRNGKIVTRWVSDDTASNEPSAALASSSVMSGVAKAPVPLNQNWDSTSRTNAEHIASMVGQGVKDPAKLWDNIDFYTGMLESKHSDIALSSIAHDGVTTSIRDAWLAKHGATLSDRAGYTNIIGDEGYEAYKDAFGRLAEAAGVAERRGRERQFEATIRGKGSTPGLNLNVDDRGNAVVDVPFERILNHKPTAREREHIAAVSDRVAARQDSTPSRYSEIEDDEPKGLFGKAGAIFDRAFDEGTPLGKMGDAISNALDETIDRHSSDSETPEDVGGSTVAWSDFNPFKRGKK